MKASFFSLLLALCVGAAATADAKPSPGAKSKRAYSHNSESSRGKTSKAQFRSQSIRPVIDLHPHKAGTFKTAKAAPSYKYYNPR
ncbi:hypothetical protein [Hymenobacter negativus]|uniref:Uncharacterized protein n=1 Tax=Hymenobacter negativus TaxID=2795026 RepID=A0ABS3QM16_9BACT|nr:hypothetical protein [Hymenobacter negativus]MBO2011725.1 hypothetical protein [Hymenobacter negativus]